MGEARKKRLLQQDPCSCPGGPPCTFALVLQPTIDRMRQEGYSIFPYRPPPHLPKTLTASRRRSIGFKLAWVRLCSARACDSELLLRSANE